MKSSSFFKINNHNNCLFYFFVYPNFDVFCLAWFCFHFSWILNVIKLGQLFRGLGSEKHRDYLIFFRFIQNFVIDIGFCNIVESITIQETWFVIWIWWKILNRPKRYSHWFDDFHIVPENETLILFRTLTIWPWYSFTFSKQKWLARNIFEFW